jgi:hypothetical protein
MQKDDATRRRIMGHFEGSKIFSKYQSETAQIDVQAVLRGLASRDVLIFSSILNGAIPNAPKTLSEAGRRNVASCLAIKSGQDLVSSTLDTLLQQYERTSDAKAANATCYRTWIAAGNALKAERNKLCQEEYRRELEAFIKEYKFQQQQFPIDEGLFVDQANVDVTG